MTSRISIQEQLPQPFSKPQELLSYTKLRDEKLVFDQSGLKYFYLPRADVESANIDLSAGFDPKKFDPDQKRAVYIDSLLRALIEYEKQQNQRADAAIISWRGTWSQIIALSQPQADRYALENGVDFLVVGYKGQIFLSPDTAKLQAESELEKQKDQQFQATASTEQKFKKLKQLQFQYTGYKFEQVAMLDKPWGQCTREEIEARYHDKSFHSDEAEYNMLIRSKIGDIPLIYAAETDGVEGHKPLSGDLHHNYVELKTTNIIKSKSNAELFERKLFKTWIQSFLSRVPKIVYGFRDPESLKLVAIEEFATDSIPKLISQSTITPKQHKWSAKRSLGFFAIMARFLKDRVEDGKTYRLTLDRQTRELVLSPEAIEIGRKVAFLSDEFVDWRESST